MDDDLAAFHAATCSRLVGELTLLTGSRADAEEVVQEAFVRLIPRWDKVRNYDEPGAWLRRVAIRLATNRWRRAQHAAAYWATVRRDEPSTHQQPVDPDLMRALAALPASQRHVVVLHYLLDLPVDHIAEQLNIRPGTVKSRLSRGRHELARLLADASAHPIEVLS